MSVRPQEPQANTTRGKPIPILVHRIHCKLECRSYYLPFSPFLHARPTPRGRFRQKESHDSIPPNDEGHQPTNRDADGI